jgi:hypothetical protein
MVTADLLLTDLAFNPSELTKRFTGNKTQKKDVRSGVGSPKKGARYPDTTTALC